jgi:hypothetical protein
MYRTVALVVLSLTVVSVSAYAADETTPSAATPTAGVQNVTPLAGNVDWSLRPVEIGAGRRPSVLPVLYVSLAALQGFDAYSTTAGLARGAQEANPMMRGVAGNSAAFWAVKAGSTAASIWLAERLWKTNRVGAIVTMVVVNGVAASVAARNASVLKQLR